MNLKFKENNILKSYCLWKPSYLFWFFSFIALFVWIFLGPISWRHIDDYGPIHEYLTNDFSFKSLNFFIKDRLIAGWGSFPPIWTIWQLISLPFSEIDLNQARFILLIQGFLSSLLTAYLTICLCLNFYTNIPQNNKYQIKKVKYFIEILSISLNCFNPEIMIHASSNMPYNLSALTTISLLLLLFPFNLNYFDERRVLNNNLFNIPTAYFFVFSFFTLFFGFQSAILFIAFLITFIRKKFSLKKISKFKLNKFIFFINQVFSGINKKLFISIFILFCFLFMSYFYKFFVLLASETKTGIWSAGIDNVYVLNFAENDLRSWILKCVNNSSSIIGLSLYPFRNFQDVISRLISIFIIFSFLISSSKNKYFSLFFLNTSLVFLATIALTTLDKFNFSPTRHTIFLYPYFWFILIISLVHIFIFIESRLNIKSYYFLVNLSLGIFLFYSIGLSNSHNLIQYSKAERDKLVDLAKKSDFQINLPLSFFPSHGSEEFKAFSQEKCDSNIKHFKSKFFIYSHRNFGIKSFSNQYLKNILINNTDGCVKKTDKIRVIDKIESFRKFDIEQNNKIYNGGSSIYAYLIEVDQNN